MLLLHLEEPHGCSAHPGPPLPRPTTHPPALLRPTCPPWEALSAPPPSPQPSSGRWAKCAPVMPYASRSLPCPRWVRARAWRLPPAVACRLPVDCLPQVSAAVLPPVLEVSQSKCAVSDVLCACSLPAGLHPAADCGPQGGADVPGGARRPGGGGGRGGPGWLQGVCMCMQLNTCC